MGGRAGGPGAGAFARIALIGLHGPFGVGSAALPMRAACGGGPQTFQDLSGRAAAGPGSLCDLLAGRVCRWCSIQGLDFLKWLVAVPPGWPGRGALICRAQLENHLELRGWEVDVG